MHLLLCLGSYYDFTKSLKIFYESHTEAILYLGNIVNGSKNSTEVLFHFLALKILQPNKYFLIRGRSETEEISTKLSFRNECLLNHILSSLILNI